MEQQVRARDSCSPRFIIDSAAVRIRHAMQANCCALQMDYDSGLESWQLA
jgi:hypothetical protein